MRLTRRTWILAVLAALGAICVDGREARARGIAVPVGGTLPIGDPRYEYLFDVQLIAGSTLSAGSFFTIYDLPSMDPAILGTRQPDLHWGASIQELGVTPKGTVVNDNPTLFNVTWQWNGAQKMAPDNSNLDLGTFIVLSTVILPKPPSGILVYVGSLDGINASNQGLVFINVPEPSSVILLLIGVGTLPLVLLNRRRLGRHIAAS